MQMREFRTLKRMLNNFVMHKESNLVSCEVLISEMHEWYKWVFFVLLSFFVIVANIQIFVSPVWNIFLFERIFSFWTYSSTQETNNDSHHLQWLFTNKAGWTISLLLILVCINYWPFVGKLICPINFYMRIQGYVHKKSLGIAI